MTKSYKELARECWIKRAEYLEERKQFHEAGDAYEKAGNLEKAKECWIKEAEKCVENQLWDWAAEAYTALHKLEEKLND